MKVVVFIPSLVIGGAERSLGKLLKCIAPQATSVDVICISHADDVTVNELPEGVNLHVLNCKSSASPFLLLKSINICRKIKPHVILGWSTYANFVAVLVAMFFSSARLVVSERNYFPIMYGRKHSNFFRRILVLCLIKKMYMRAHVITANSSATVKALRRFIGMKFKYGVLPNTVDVAHLDEMASYFNGLLPINDSPRLLAIGRLVPQKGFDVLLRAFSLVHSQRPNWILTVVGYGPERERLQSLACSLDVSDYVRWVGPQSNPFPFYRWCDFVIVPSRFEGFPNVPLEAMALGRAVICSNCKSGPSELTERGRYGRLVPVENVNALATEIIQLGDCLDSARLLGGRARQHIKQKYDNSVVAEVYSEIVFNRPPV